MFSVKFEQPLEHRVGTACLQRRHAQRWGIQWDKRKTGCKGDAERTRQSEEDCDDLKWYMSFMADWLPVSDIKRLKHIMDSLTRVQREVIVEMHEKVVNRFVGKS